MKKVINYILFTSSLIFIGLNNTLAADCISCGTDTLPIPVGIPKFVSSLITLAQVAVPVLIIVISMVNYIKAVGNGEDKVIREVNLKFIRSLISGVAIFLLVAIVRFAFGTLLGSTGNDTLTCISCFVDSSTCQETACLGRPDLDNSDSNSQSKKHCGDYTTEEECPEYSDYGYKCEWSSREGGRPKCLSVE